MTQFNLHPLIQEGHPVQIEGIGTFTPSFSAKSQLVEEEANLSSIRSMRLNFLPAVALKEALKKMDFVFDKTDSTQDFLTPQEPDVTEPEPENPDTV